MMKIIAWIRKNFILNYLKNYLFFEDKITHRKQNMIGLLEVQVVWGPDWLWSKIFFAFNCRLMSVLSQMDLSVRHSVFHFYLEKKKGQQNELDIQGCERRSTKQIDPFFGFIPMLYGALFASIFIIIHELTTSGNYYLICWFQ